MGKGTALMKLARPVVKLTRHGLRLLSKHSNLVLTVLSATGVMISVAVTVRGTIKAVKLYEEKQPFGTKEIIATVWKCYIPTIGMVFLTTMAIVCNGRINAKKIAVLTSALSGSVEALRSMEGKMSEMIGPKKAQAVIDEVHSQKATENLPKNENDIINTGHGNQLFFLEDVGQWIMTDTNRVELAELKVKDLLEDSNDWDENGDGYILLNDALNELGGRTCYYGSTNGWNSSDLKEVGYKGPKFRISSKIMEINGEKRPVGTIWFEPQPSPI